MIEEWAVEQFTRFMPSAIYDGMAPGTDRIIAAAAKKLGIPIICCYPFPKNKFPPLEEWLMENNQVIFVCPTYSKASYIIRDKYMVDHADALLCVWDGVPAGGTYQTYKYALSKNIPVIRYRGLEGEKK